MYHNCTVELENYTGVSRMRENKQVYQKETTPRMLEDLFENETFQKYSPLFYESPKTITQVSENTGVSRRTIYNQFENFLLEGRENYDSNYIKIVFRGRTAEKPLIFTHKIVVDLVKYLARIENQEFSPSQDEEKMLLDLMNLPGIDNCLRKQSKNWFVVFSKLTAILVAVPYFAREIEKKVELPQKAPRVEKLSVFKWLTIEEVDALNQDLQKFLGKNPTFKDLAEKFCTLEIPIFSTPRDLYTLIKDQVEISMYIANLFLRDPRIKKIAQRKIVPLIRKEWGMTK